GVEKTPASHPSAYPGAVGAVRRTRSSMLCPGIPEAHSRLAGDHYAAVRPHAHVRRSDRLRACCYRLSEGLTRCLFYVPHGWSISRGSTHNAIPCSCCAREGGNAMTILETENHNLRRRMREIEMELRSLKVTHARVIEENVQLKNHIQALDKQLKPGADWRVNGQVE